MKVNFGGEGQGMTMSYYPSAFHQSTRPRSAIGAIMLMVIAWNDVTNALQSPLMTKSYRTKRLFMTETSYPFEKSPKYISFLAPLFSDNSDRPRRRGISSSSAFVVNSGFSFLEESNLYDDIDERNDELLSYLPSGGASLTPRTKELIKRVTLQYVNGDEQNVVKAQDVLDVVDEEYRSYDVPMSIGSESFDVTQTGEDSDGDAARIVSFAALHRLPRDITIVLFGPTNDGSMDSQKDEYKACREAFAKGGWQSVRFERGLAVRLQRKFVSTNRERYAPLPRSWLTSRRKALREAETAINEAASASAPARRLLSREEFLASMDEELSTEKPLVQNIFRDALLSFPRQNRVFKRLKRKLVKQTRKLKQAGLAGILTFEALTLAWYTLAIVWQWPAISSTVAVGRAAFGTALRRFSKVFAAAFLASKLTRLWRIQLALALTPFGNRVLKATEVKFRISESRAFGVLAGVMVLSCLTIWATIVLGDAAILRAWVMEGVQRQTELLQLNTA